MRTITRLARLAAVGITLLLVAAACSTGTIGADEPNNQLISSDNDTNGADGAGGGDYNEAAQPAGPTASGSGIESARLAVVRILQVGDIATPEGEGVSVGTGTGFIIDPSGLAVTNNHVAGGAAILEVTVDGETEPRNAKVLGLSECADLAVIDIEGDDFPYVDFYQGDIVVGTDVLAAGYPLGTTRVHADQGHHLHRPAGR